MSLRIFFLALLASLICITPSSRLMAQQPEDKCEEAIAKKLKAAKKPGKITFASDTRKMIPHGLMTHYAGKGSYVMLSGDSVPFDWFCDFHDASGKLANLHYLVSNIDEPTKKEPAKKAETPKYEAKPPKPWVQECQSVVESVIKKKNPTLSALDFHSAKVSRASNSEDLVEGEGSFKGNSDEEMTFNYRCAYNIEKGKITAKSIQMK